MTTAHAEQHTTAEQPANKAERIDRVLTEYCDSRGIAVRIDRERSLIHGVKILGIKSRNGRTYLPDALLTAVKLYEGAPVNVNHPKGHPTTPRDYQDRIGRIENVTFRHGEGLFGDFRFNPKHNLVEQLLWDAEHAQENVGFSHNVQARVAQQDKQLAVEAITKVNSVDLVADPATTNGLFESAANTSERASSQTLTGAHDRSAHEMVAFDGVAFDGAAVDGAAVDGTAAIESTDPKSAKTPSVMDVTLAELRTLRPDLIDQLTEELAGELADLRREVDRLQATEAYVKKTSTAYALLEEFDLPRPHSDDPVASAITSDHFFDSLINAANDSAMRALVEERATLAKHICRGSALTPTPPAKPVSRDPDDVYGHAQRFDTASFVESIT